MIIKVPSGSMGSQKISRVQGAQKRTPQSVKPSKPSEENSAEKLLEAFKLAQDKNKFIHSLSEKQVKLILDHWGALVESLTPINEVISNCAEIVKTYVKENEMPELSGEVFDVTCSGSNSTEITMTITEIMELLKKEKKTNFIDKIFKVALGDTKKLLGDIFIKKIGTDTFTAFTTVKGPTRKK